MKFTKEDAHKELVSMMTARGEALNLSTRSFNEQLEKLIPLVANEDTELNDFVEKVLPFFKTADANVRNDVSVGISEYKKNNPIVTPKEEGKKPVMDEETLNRIAALEAKLKESESKERTAKVKKEVADKLKEKGVKNTEWIEGLLSDVVITEEFDVEARAESYLNLYNKMQSAVDPNITPKGGQGGKGGNTYLDAIKKASEKAKQEAEGMNV